MKSKKACEVNSRDAGADEGGHKQAARGACHRKPKRSRTCANFLTRVRMGFTANSEARG